MAKKEGLYYSNEHIWLKKIDANQVRMGITSFALAELGEVVFVELPEVGDQAETSEPFGSVESVKTVSELYTPVSGKVVAVNERLHDSPQLVNESPYEEAWFVDVELSDESQLEQLMTATQYEKMISGD